MKRIIAVVLTVTIFCLVLAACSNLSVDEEMAFFTINLGGKSRLAYTPGSGPAATGTGFPTVSDLKFVVQFTPTSPPGANGTKITVNGSDVITGTIAPGEYNVTIDILLAADDTICYASGGAPANPVTVNAGKNTIPVSVTQNYIEDGSSTFPFLVYDEATLLDVGSGGAGGPGSGLWKLGDYYRVIKDISMSATPFPPIGTTTPFFTGSFDGNNKTISNMVISGVFGQVGLFSTIAGGVGKIGEVKNLGLDIAINVNSGQVGGIAGSSNQGTIENCHVTGTVTAPGHMNVGGIVGSNRGTVERCSFTGSVSSDDKVGGIAGLNSGGTVQYCYVTAPGSVGGRDSVGGIVGSSEAGSSGNSTVNHCYATCDVTGSGNYVGGVVGNNYVNGNGPPDYYATVEQCYYADGTVKTTGTGMGIGGVVGKNQSDGSTSYATVYNCYATGTVIGSYSVGGIVGYNTNTAAGANCVVENCYSTCEVESTSGSSGNVGGIVGYSGIGTGAVCTVENCVALNSKLICAYGSNYRRVVGQNVGTLSNIYGKEPMAGTPVTPWSTPTASDGTSISSWNSSSWWSSVFSSAPSGVWIFRNGPPILDNMPGDRAQ